MFGLRTVTKLSSRKISAVVSKRNISFPGNKAKVEEKPITIPLDKPFKTYQIQFDVKEATTTRSELLAYFKQMYEIRRVEILADNLYKQRLIRGFLHLYNGQEAITSGMEGALTMDDHIITAYRDHGTFIGRKGSAFECLAELMGRKPGCSGGKGGSMHMYKKDANFHGGNGIVGAQVPIGTGVAFGLKYQGKPNVCMTMYGDGAANQGQVFEAYNMAALWKLPCIYVCENNHYGMGTSAARSSFDTNYHRRGAYIPGILVDGMNVLAVREAVKFAKNYAIKEGPIILEMETYRYYGHSMSDPGLAYRSKEEVAQVRESRDPIEKVKGWLTRNGLATEEELTAIEEQIKADTEEALAKAKAAPWPEEKDLYSDIYSDEKYFVRGVEMQQSRVVENKH